MRVRPVASAAQQSSVAPWFPPDTMLQAAKTGVCSIVNGPGGCAIRDRPRSCTAPKIAYAGVVRPHPTSEQHEKEVRRKSGAVHEKNCHRDRDERVWSLAATTSADTLIMRDGTRVPERARWAYRRPDDHVQGHAWCLASLQHQPGRGSRVASASQTNVGGSANARRLETLPSGTELVVRTVEDIDSTTAVANQTFSAIFEHDVAGASTDVLVPEGSRAALVIREVSSGGATGGPEMAAGHSSDYGPRAALSRQVRGHEKKSDTGIGKNKRTAQTVGGGAVLGTIIGAIVGGGKGAAIGGVAGAAGGAGVQVLTKGKNVRVPAETVLRFRLDKAVSLQAAR